MTTATTSNSSVVEWLRVIGEDQFRTQVAEDCHGRADAEVSEGLRHHAVRRRWYATIKLLLVDVNAQFGQHRGDQSPEAVAWRAKALRWQESLIARRDEARRLCMLPPPGDGESRAASERARRERGEVGDLAVQRLIDRHREEFDAILIEEFDAAGIDPPPGVRSRRRISAAEALEALRDTGVLHG